MQTSFRLVPVKLVEDVSHVWRFTDCCEKLHGPVFAHVTTGPSKQYWGRFYSFISFIAARFIATVLRINRAYSKSVYVPSSVVNLCSLINGMDVCLEKGTRDLWVSPPNYMAVSPECMLPWKHLHFTAVWWCWRTSMRQVLVAVTHIEQRGAPWISMGKKFFVRCLHFSLLLVEEYCQVVLQEKF